MQVGETVAAVTVGSLAGFLARLRQNGAPDDTAIALHHHKNAGGWTLSADFEPHAPKSIDATRRELQGPPGLTFSHSFDERDDGAVPA